MSGIGGPSGAGSAMSIDRIMALPLEHFRQRNARKNAAGFSGAQSPSGGPDPAS